MALERNTPLTDFPGIGPAKAKALARLGLLQAGDLLAYFPQRYEDRRQCWTIGDAPLDQACCVRAMVAEEPRLSRVRRGLELVKVRGVDGSGVLNLTFFNQPYVKNSLKRGETYVFYGKLEPMGRARSMANPVFEVDGAHRITGVIVPVYPLTAGITNNLLSGLVRRAVESLAGGIPEALPEAVRRTHRLCGAEYAYRNIHNPESFEALRAARRRLIFEELLTLTCGLALLKGRRKEGAGRRLPADPAEFARLLPFEPTAAQRRAMADMAADFVSGRSMNRLVQGDVGSGKTAVAAYGAWAAAKNGWQCALMAPTELLAEQHYRTLSALLGPAGVRVELLTGGVKGAERRRVLAGLADGTVDVAVGTHALFSEEVTYRALALVIADEQHRFGVAQRAALAAKGAGGAPEEETSGVHVLVMSATPIPRTLALMIYGDLDVSLVNELPPGRTPVATYVVGEDKRQRMYGFVRRQAAEGWQVYIVCPAVEETQAGAEWGADPAARLELKAASAYAEELRTAVFPELRVGIVHGRMKAREKEAAMAAFAAGQLDVLVSTTVIEVGVDVPNASLIVVENAERFGLSQLHQLRGRVGRGAHQSYCVLMTSSRANSARERLRILAGTNDGFQIAEEDLRLRGPGDFFGRRQHGLPQLRVANFSTDMALLEEARAAAQALVAADENLALPEHWGLRRQVGQMFREEPDIFQ